MFKFVILPVLMMLVVSVVGFRMAFYLFNLPDQPLSLLGFAFFIFLVSADVLVIVTAITYFLGGTGEQTETD